MRLFLGLSLPDLHRDVLQGLQKHLPPGRPVPWDNFHLTLGFLGDASDAMVDELHLSLDGMRMVLPALTLRGLGQFGGASPRVVWVSVDEIGSLGKLHTRLKNVARGAGFEVPKRKFIPHVTLTRFTKDAVAAAPIARFLESQGAVALPAFQPWAVTLFQSHLRAHGPVYEPLADYPVTPDQTI